jgi:hypothetical protein
MYISEILEYLLWPAFIILSWFVIKYALSVYESKFSEKEQPVNQKSNDSAEAAR